ncbi:hypothetical protein J6590_081744 [Homalodisca vitripennis]|nr:hypothetical protein J6590_081744 [Homalodisca vitripennis]
MEEDQDWDAEAVAVIKDIKPHVKDIRVSSVVPASKGICLNITTLEGQDLTMANTSTVKVGAKVPVGVEGEGGPESHTPPWPEWNDAFIKTVSWAGTKPPKKSFNGSYSTTSRRSRLRSLAEYVRFMLGFMPTYFIGVFSICSDLDDLSTLA